MNWNARRSLLGQKGLTKRENVKRIKINTDRNREDTREERNRQKCEVGKKKKEME